VTSIQAALVLIFCGFAMSSFVRWLYYRVLTSRTASRLRHKINPVQENLVPASQHSASVAIEEVNVEK
jgi:hypothetical protein